MRARFLVLAAALVSFAVFSIPAHATFHLMQIEQVIGGVDGDRSAQAIQLRMRLNGQGELSRARLVVRDANGRNPVVLIDFTTDVTPELQGGRIFIASPGFAAYTTPAAVPDFLLANLIPQGYLAAGSLRYERNSGLVLWRLSWGGSSYRGSNRGLHSNDQDGMFGLLFPSRCSCKTQMANTFRTPVSYLTLSQVPCMPGKSS